MSLVDTNNNPQQAELISKFIRTVDDLSLQKTT